MGRLVGWHTRVGEVGLRLFCLHLLWIVGTLAGGVVLGVFPASAAVVAVLRRDVRRGDDEARRDEAALRRVHPDVVPLEERAGLGHEFVEQWRASFGPANRLGWTLVALWALVLLDRRLVSTVDLGAAGPAAAGLLWVLALVLGIVTLTAGSLAAHFDEGVPAVLRRSLVLLVARPVQALLHTAAVGAVLCAYYLLPGLVPVFGVALPAYVSFTVLWHSGLLPRPAAPVGSSPAGPPARHPGPPARHPGPPARHAVPTD